MEVFIVINEDGQIQDVFSTWGSAEKYVEKLKEQMGWDEKEEGPFVRYIAVRYLVKE